jgi:imidazolonepropionase-like amidohydrolase
VADFGETGVKDAEVFDLQGRTIIPGLINCHQHLDQRHGWYTLPMRAAQPQAYSVARAVRNCLLDLQEGVTTVRYLDYKYVNSVPIRQAIQDGVILGPHIVSCGPPLAVTGGHAWHICIEVNGVDAVRQAVRCLIKEGVDVIKLIARGGYPRDESQPWLPQFTAEEMRAAFEEAHNSGKLTTINAHSPFEVRLAVEAGVDCIEHGGKLDPPTAELLARKGIWLVPTLGETWMTAFHGEEFKLPQSDIDKCREGLTDQMQAFACAVAAGVKMPVGTNMWPPFAKEMELMVEGGMSRQDVLVSATRYGAEVCGLRDKTGTLEVGKWADVIVLDGNPLQDLGAMSRVKMVFKGGVLYRPEALAAGTGKYPM